MSRRPRASLHARIAATRRANRAATHPPAARTPALRFAARTRALGLAALALALQVTLIGDAHAQEPSVEPPKLSAPDQEPSEPPQRHETQPTLSSPPTTSQRGQPDAPPRDAPEEHDGPAKLTTQPEIDDFVEALPEPVQETAAQVTAQMVASRYPPKRFLYSVFGLPRGRFGTGTSWLPDESPLLAAIPHFGKWGLITHGTIYTGYDYYSSARGGRRFFGRNTLMGGLFRTFAHSEMLFRLALSFEPLTIGSRGYPQVLQSGQTRDGERIHDRMYALDFFREVAFTHTWEVTSNWGAVVYAALAGEPAVGPVSFTQRVSASPDPLAPLSFVAQETSHASFGVLTVGAFTREFKLEASWFNGQLPGAHKFALALRRPDSYSGRISWNPYTWLSTQLSYAFLGNPSRRYVGRSDHRLSASASYTRWRANDSGLAATLSFGQRITTRGHINTSLMAEAYWNIEGHHAVYGRSEILQKSASELVLPEAPNELFAIGALSAGYIYYFGPFITLTPGLGVRASVNFMEEDLSRFYGGRAAYGLMVYAQLRTVALPIGT